MAALQTLREASKSRTTLAVFGLLVVSWLVPQVVDIYASPIFLALGLPSYLVTMLLYDSAFGLENLVYPVYPLAEAVVGDGHLLWEAGRLVTFYLFALVVGWLVRAIRPRNPSSSESPVDSDATR